VTPLLPDGNYPFANVRLPLKEMAMMEAPASLEQLLIRAADAAGIAIHRDKPVEVTCSSEDYPEATFLVFWPSGNERINILAPLGFVTGRA
jgi:hypothetical protein